MPVNDQGDAYKLLYPFGWQVMITATPCYDPCSLLVSARLPVARV